MVYSYKEKDRISDSDYVEFKLKEINNNPIAELKKIIEDKEDENRELNAIIDRLSEDNEELKEKFDASIIIIKSLMNRINEKGGLNTPFIVSRETSSPCVPVCSFPSLSDQAGYAPQARPPHCTLHCFT